jgi:hypothetical protein
VKKLRRGVYADLTYVESTAATPTTTALHACIVPQEVERNHDPAKPVAETITAVPVEKIEQSSGPEDAFNTLYQHAFREWKWSREKFTEMYYKIGEVGMKDWLAVYRANTKYICRLPPAEFEDLVTTLGLDHVESVIQRQKREQDRIADCIEEEERRAREIADDGEDDDDTENDLSYDWRSCTMKAKELPTAKPKLPKAAKPSFRY